MVQCQRFLVLQWAVLSWANIIRMDRKGPPAEPASLQAVENRFVPTNSDLRWSNHDFLSGVIFGVLSCGIIMALLMGCQVLRFVPPEPRSECEVTVDPHLDQSPTSEEVETLNKFWPRAGWLASMLLLQSISGIILSRFEVLVRKNTDLIFFLTMLVGLGGNTGGQSVLLTCRKLIQHEPIAVRDQLLTGLLIGMVLAPLSFLRGLASRSDIKTCITLATATLLIATVAVAVGTALPKLLRRMNADPGQAAAMIQVFMDILGIMITCSVGALILDTL